jgi:hypothetical protein
MRKTTALIFILLLCLPVLLYSQSGGQEDEPDIEDDWDVYQTDLYAAGDKAFIISLGTVFPAVFLNNGNVIQHNLTPPVGGTGSLSYNYFLNSRFFTGVEVSGMFLPTVDRSTAYIIPIGLRIGYQFLIWRLEFPITLTTGINWHRYLNVSYFGYFVKGGAGAYFRYNSEWSFGINSNWCWLPEWTNEPSKNIDGNIVELTLSARYHF